jgi:hypothetical protein
MYTKSISTVSGAVLLALTATAYAGPMSVTSSKLIAPPKVQTESVYYRYYGYNGWNPGAAVAGTALGLLTLGAIGATGAWGYGYPYYGSYAYYGAPYGYYGSPYYSSYGYYGRPYYRHYGYWHSGGIYTGRSVGYSTHMHGGAHK